MSQRANLKTGGRGLQMHILTINRGIMSKSTLQFGQRTQATLFTSSSNIVNT